jgi:hypothetical protein
MGSCHGVAESICGTKLIGDDEFSDGLRTERLEFLLGGEVLALKRVLRSYLERARLRGA